MKEYVRTIVPTSAKGVVVKKVTCDRMIVLERLVKEILFFSFEN